MVLLPARVNSLYQPHGGLVHAGLQALWMPALDYYPGITAQTVIDRSGNGNTLTLGSTGGVDANDPSWSQQGLVFNAASSSQAYPPLSAQVAQNPEFTVQFVVRQPSGSGDSVIYSEGQSGTTRGFALSGNQSGTNVAAAQIRSDTYNVSVAVAPGTSFVLLTARVLADVLRMDVNALTLTATNGGVGATHPTADTILEGGPAWAGLPGFFSGTIAAQANYSRGLPDGEVLRNYRWFRAQLASKGISLP